jgi:hypothetical protein
MIISAEQGEKSSDEDRLLSLMDYIEVNAAFPKGITVSELFKIKKMMDSDADCPYKLDFEIVGR